MKEYSERSERAVYAMLALILAAVIIWGGRLAVTQTVHAAEPESSIFKMLERTQRRMESDPTMIISLVIKSINDKQLPYGRIKELNTEYVCLDGYPGHDGFKWCVPLENISYIGSNKPIWAQ